MRKRKKIFFTNIFKNVYFFNFLCQIAFFRRLRPPRPPGGPSDGPRPGLARLRQRGRAGDGQPGAGMEDVRGRQGQGRLPGKAGNLVIFIFYFIKELIKSSKELTKYGL